MTRAKTVNIIDEHSRGTATQDRLTAAVYRVLNLRLTDSNIIQRISKRSPALVLMRKALVRTVHGIQVADMLQSRPDVPLVHVMRNHGTGRTTLHRWSTTVRFGYLLETPDAKHIAGTTGGAPARGQLGDNSAAHTSKGTDAGAGGICA